MNSNDIMVSNKIDFLNFLKSKFSLIHNSNLFFRDFHFGLMEYLVLKNGKKINYTTGEQLARKLAEDFENQGLFSKIDHQSWRLNYPEFALPRAEKKAS